MNVRSIAIPAAGLVAGTALAAAVDASFPKQDPRPWTVTEGLVLSGLVGAFAVVGSELPRVFGATSKPVALAGALCGAAFMTTMGLVVPRPSGASG